MCVYSVIADDYNKYVPYRWPWIETIPSPNTQPFQYPPLPAPSREEFEGLKRELEELKLLLRAAKRYDEATGQKDCENDEKIALLRKLANFVGVDLEDVLDFGGV